MSSLQRWFTFVHFNLQPKIFLKHRYYTCSFTYTPQCLLHHAFKTLHCFGPVSFPDSSASIFTLRFALKTLSLSYLVTPWVLLPHNLCPHCSLCFGWSSLQLPPQANPHLPFRYQLRVTFSESLHYPPRRDQISSVVWIHSTCIFYVITLISVCNFIFVWLS